MSYKFKKLSSYLCPDCKKKRYTVKPEKVKTGICRACLIKRNPPGMQSMFDDTEDKSVESVNK